MIFQTASDAAISLFLGKSLAGVKFFPAIPPGAGASPAPRFTGSLDEASLAVKRGVTKATRDLVTKHPNLTGNDMSDIKPDAKTTMAVHIATGLPVLKARDFILISSPEVIRRILAGEKVRHAAHLASLPDELSVRIRDAGRSQSIRQPLLDPIEDDSAMGPIVRRVLEEVCEEMEAQHGRVTGLCHAIWRRARERLWQEHGITWYSPAQMNPGCCFD